MDSTTPSRVFGADGLDGADGGNRVDRIGLAVLAAVGVVDLDDADPARGQVTGQARAVDPVRSIPTATTGPQLVNQVSRSA
jgi:hypothetical protein